MKKNLIVILTALIALTTFNSCYNTTKYELTIDRVSYVGNELRLDGYYYHQYETSRNVIYTKILFFYRNGVIFDGEVFTTSNFDTIENYFINGEHDGYINDRDVWSTFKVSNDSLIYERWNPPTVSQGPEPIKYYGEILNDTTFKVYKYKLYSEKEFNEVSDTYHFRQFDQKPDSTNSFID